MNSGSAFRGVVGVTITTLIGAISFFVIIGVFGQEAAIAGLLLFVASAIVIYRAVSLDGGTS
jgi:hypothetical protein